MIRLICIKCGKDSYREELLSYSPCPYCGFIFSGRHGADKRHKERINREIPFDLSYEAENYRAKTLNYSMEGLGIKIFGDPPLAANQSINLTIQDTSIKATVMWMKIMHDESLLGLSVDPKDSNLLKL